MILIFTVVWPRGFWEFCLWPLAEKVSASLL